MRCQCAQQLLENLREKNLAILQECIEICERLVYMSSSFKREKDLERDSRYLG
jgi:hypothetical protein